MEEGSTDSSAFFIHTLCAAQGHPRLTSDGPFTMGSLQNKPSIIMKVLSGLPRSSGGPGCVVVYQNCLTPAFAVPSDSAWKI